MANPLLQLVQYRGGTATAWTSANPILANGEIGYESDTGLMKVGTGTTSWTSLGYSTPAAGSINPTTQAPTLTQIAGISINTVTTAGDLIVGTGAASVERLAKGSVGNVLTVGGGDPSGLEWIAPIAPSNSPFSSYQVDSSSPILLAAGRLDIANTGSATFDLPIGPTPGQVFGVQRGTSTGTLVISAGSVQTINNTASVTLTTTGAVAQSGYVWFTATSASTYSIISAVGTDVGLGWDFGGAVNVQGVFTANGTNSMAGLTQVSGTLRWGTTLTKTANYTTTATQTLWTRCITNAFTLTLGTTSFGSGQIQMATNENTVASGNFITLAAASGTIDLTSLPPQSGAIFQFDGTNWHTVGAWGTSVNSSNRVAYTSPSLSTGTAASVSTTADAWVYMTCTTSASVNVTTGPSTGAENTIVPTVTAPVGAYYTWRVPATHKYIVNGTIANFSIITQTE